MRYVITGLLIYFIVIGVGNLLIVGLPLTKEGFLGKIDLSPPGVFDPPSAVVEEVVPGDPAVWVVTSEFSPCQVELADGSKVNVHWNSGVMDGERMYHIVPYLVRYSVDNDVGDITVLVFEDGAVQTFSAMVGAGAFFMVMEGGKGLSKERLIEELRKNELKIQE